MFRGASRPDSEFDAKELEMGVPDEMKEHGVGRAIALAIVKGHLLDNPKYYSDLKAAGMD